MGREDDGSSSKKCKEQIMNEHSDNFGNEDLENAADLYLQHFTSARSGLTGFP